MVKIRRYTRSDIEKVLKLAHEAHAGMKTVMPLSEEQLKRVLNNNITNALFFGTVMEEKEEIVGFGIGKMGKEPWADEGICTLDMLFVREDFRSTANVELLSSSFRDWSRQRGVKEVEINNCCMPEFKLNSDYSVERVEL